MLSLIASTFIGSSCNFSSSATFLSKKNTRAFSKISIDLSNSKAFSNSLKSDSAPASVSANEIALIIFSSSSVNIVYCL